MKGLVQDIRYGLRMLARNPGVTAVAVLALALGIGANTAIFSLVNAVLVRPLPFEEPDRLVRVFEENVARGFLLQTASGPNFTDWRDRSRSFENLAVYDHDLFNLTGGDLPEIVGGGRVSAGFFDVLGLEPVLGRALAGEDFRPAGVPVLVLSEGLWRRRFGGDPTLIGRQIRVDGESREVVGVMEGTGQWPSVAELWVPITDELGGLNRRSQFLTVVGRLEPGVSLDGAQAEMTALGASLEAEYPEANAGWSVRIVRFRDYIVDESESTGLLILMGAVGFVLLIACANVANILLGRMGGRRGELAVRRALGASRLRLARLLLVESLLLAILGGASALLATVWTASALEALVPQSLMLYSRPGIDGAVLVFTLLVSAATSFGFGLLPAVAASRADIAGSIGEDGVRSGSAGWRTRSALVVTEVALAFGLLMGAGLMMRSLEALSRVDLGFNPENVLTMRVPLPEARYREAAEREAFFSRLVTLAASLPEVETAAVARTLPPGGHDNISFSIEGRPQAPGEELSADYNVVSAGFFPLMAIRVAAGRDFDERDRMNSEPVTVISESMARLHWPGEDPLGRQITIDDGGPNPRRIVGLVPDIRHQGLDGPPQPIMYVPAAGMPQATMTLLARTRVPPATLADAVRGAIATLDPDQPAASVAPLRERVAALTSGPRFNALALGLFAAMATLLAVIGIYGVISYSVSLRAHEFGVRLAVGASPRDLLRLVLGQGMRLTAAGLGLGVLIGVAAGRLLSSLLYGVTPTDVPTFLLVMGLLGTAALAGCWIPAVRATRADPVRVLRQ